MPYQKLRVLGGPKHGEFLDIAVGTRYLNVPIPNPGKVATPHDKAISSAPSWTVFMYEIHTIGFASAHEQVHVLVPRHSDQRKVDWLLIDLIKGNN